MPVIQKTFFILNDAAKPSASADEPFSGCHKQQVKSSSSFLFSKNSCRFVDKSSFSCLFYLPSGSFPCIPRALTPHTSISAFLCFLPSATAQFRQKASSGCPCPIFHLAAVRWTFEIFPGLLLNRGPICRPPSWCRSPDP